MSKSSAPIPFSDSRWRGEAAILPDERELWQRHRAFRRLDLRGRSLDYIKETFYNYYGLFPMTQVPFDALQLNKAGLYRARWINPDLEDVGLIAKHSYPEAKFCKTMGRANLPGKPVLYLSERPTTALFEIGARRDVDQRLFITKWKLEPGLVQTYMVMPGSNSGGRSSEVHDQVRAKIRSKLELQGSGKVDSLMALSECWSELFLDENYPVTSWMADKIFSYDPAPFDMLAYPSVARRRQSVCYAVPRRVVDQGRLKLVAAIAIDIASSLLISDMGDFQMKVRGFARAIVNGNELNWEPMDDIDGLSVDFPDLLRLWKH